MRHHLHYVQERQVAVDQLWAVQDVVVMRVQATAVVQAVTCAYAQVAADMAVQLADLVVHGADIADVQIECAVV